MLSGTVEKMNIALVHELLTMRGGAERVFKIIAEKKTPERQKKLRSLFDDMIAYEEFCKGSLGDQWGKRTAKGTISLHAGRQRTWWTSSPGPK